MKVKTKSRKESKKYTMEWKQAIRMMKELDNVIRKYKVMLVIESVDVWLIQETRKIYIFQKHSTIHFMESILRTQEQSKIILTGTT